ncbi:DUF86 domain-containing protein [Lacihabitans sp. CCS-44]|uniref:HepT-like ribonuclease domain-containing protein n=1 Tax=Lacihabitans sp. CCS-44 TaxID=2487331 RepID=UPI0020CC05CE|nr:HepT-like ribonuclease domain-containing protein [Lacihabitans sp. CCS-44]MCP9754715.1 DUF86 domain-containing protein [Lacihabitans sp. CCS-44]
MSEKVLKCLYDIKYAIEEIENFLSIQPKQFGAYKKNLLLKRAIERNLEIVGEAMSRILKEDSEIAISNAKRIIGLRNQIIHGYDSVSDENIWAILINHMPILKREIESLINPINS